MRLKLHTIIASTRPGRVGPAIAGWFHQVAQAHGGFDPVLVDIGEFNLPVYDEAAHPTLQRYAHAHTKAWAASVESADAFVFVTPEHNYGPPASLVNALNYVFHEWACKPAAFVSYGGISGGLRGVQVTKQLLTTLKIMPLTEGVVIPNYGAQIDEAGAFRPNDIQIKAAESALDELKRWAEALVTLRPGRASSLGERDDRSRLQGRGTGGDLEGERGRRDQERGA
jgi:NAD(P)H-dependent FMN reductase